MTSQRLLAFLVFAIVASPATAHDWPQFLGPNRDGVVTETGLNWDWKAKPPKVLWKVPLGSAFSSAAVVGNRLFTMAKNGAMDGVVCLDADTGKTLWTFDFVPSYLDQQKQGAGPRATPTHDNGKIYCLFARGELLCLDVHGKKLWDAHTFNDVGSKSNEAEFRYWGVSLSPIVEGNLVIVQPGGTKNNAVAAYDKNTGKLVWTTGSDPAGYSSPIAIDVGGTRQIVMPTGQSILGIAPAKGEILWRYTFGNQFNATCANPVWADNKLFVSAGYGAGAALLDIVPPKSPAEKWATREVWATKKNLNNLMATSVVHNGHLYGCHGEFVWFMRCLDFKTGKIKWDERVTSRQSLLLAEGHLLSMSERGTLTLLEANPDRYVVKAELPNILTYKTWAIPALVNGKLYIRDERQMLCLDLRK